MRDRPDQTDLLSSLGIPVLILVGDADSITPPSVAQEMKRHMPNAKLTIIQGSGHAAPIEQSSQVTRALREFVQSIDAG